MHDPRLSALFDRYRREGDLSALAKVFDEISPEMMRVARHVAGRGVDPEDVVQATFLASIERSDAFDATRPIVPWLMGILINQARLMNRRRATRHEESSAEELPSTGAVPDDAEAREVQDAVARALADLPPTYRDVLVAHLAEGKQPHEIARDLGRPQGTVRAQIHRGLRIVRRSLPGGFAFGIAVMLDRSALAGARRTVLSSAARAKSLPPSAIPAATSTSNLPLGVAGAAVVLAGVVGLAWLGGRAARADPELVSGADPRSGPGFAPADRPAGGARAAVGSDASDAAERGPDAPRAASAAAGTVRVVVRDALGAPVAGVHVDLLAWGDPLWHEHVRALVTDRDGSAEFPRVAVGRVGVHLDGGGVQSRADVLPGGRTDIAIALERGLDLSGVVRDPRGSPIEGAIVEAGDPLGGEPRRVSGPTGPDGRYVLRDVARNLAAWARGDGRAPSEAVWFDAPGWIHLLTGEADFVLGDPVAPLAFAVVDGRGQPVPGAQAVALARTTEGYVGFRSDGALALDPPGARASAGADGAVSLCLDRARSDRVLVTAAGFAARELDVDDVGTLVALDAGARLAGVARYRDGVAAEEALVEARSDSLSDPLRARSGRDGSWEILDAPAGPITLSARAAPDAASVESRVIASAGGTVTWHPMLDHASVIRGVARSAHGGPAKTWLVKAVREDAGDGPVLTAWTRSPRDPARRPDLRQCWTGEQDGVFAVPCAAGATYRLELRARAAWNGQVHGALDGVAAGAQDVDLRVQLERGFVRARFVDAAGRPAAGTLTAVRRGSGAEHHRQSQVDGSAERDLSPGTYAVVAWPAGGAPRALGVRAVGADEVVDFGDVVVDATGELTIHGAAGARLVLRGIDGLAYHLERAGPDLVARRVPPGAYVLGGRRADGQAFETAVRVAADSVVRVAVE